MSDKRILSWERHLRPFPDLAQQPCQVLPVSVSAPANMLLLPSCAFSYSERVCLLYSGGGLDSRPPTVCRDDELHSTQWVSFAWRSDALARVLVHFSTPNGLIKPKQRPVSQSDLGNGDALAGPRPEEAHTGVQVHACPSRKCTGCDQPRADLRL